MSSYHLVYSSFVLISENLYIGAMKIRPIHSFIVNHTVPIESSTTGRLPYAIQDGFLVFRITRAEGGDSSYGLLAFVFPESYETIRPHEHTIMDKLSEKKQDILSGKLVDKPVCLLYYQADDITRALITGFEQGEKITRIRQGEFAYEYALCDRAQWARDLIGSVDGLDKMVIADGHHRTAAYFAQRQNQESDPGLFCALMPLDQIKVHSYHRKISFDQPLLLEFLVHLHSQYKIENTTVDHVLEAFGPWKKETDQMFYYHKGQWATMDRIPDGLATRPGSADLLLEFEEQIFVPFCQQLGLQVYDHMEYISGSELEIDGLVPRSDEILLLFPPVDPQFLWDASIRGEVMPAKSTWIEPRMPSDVIQVPSSYE